MSRIGNLPVNLPAGVNVKVDDNNLVSVKGPLGELTQQIDAELKITIEENEVKITRDKDEKELRSKHGLYRSLINNMVIGVSQGYTIQQEFVGVGYKAEVKGQLLEMSLGFSHDIHFQLPAEVKGEAKTERRGNPMLTLKSHDKQLLGHVAAKIRSFRKPEPYKGKGIKFVGEQLRKKAGKSASAK